MIDALDDFDPWSNSSRLDSYRSELRVRDVDLKTRNAFFGAVELVKAKGSGEIGGTVSWGDPDGVEFSGYAEGEVHDRYGNYAKGKIEYYGDNAGKVDFSIGHEEEEDSD